VRPHPAVVLGLVLGSASAHAQGNALSAPTGGRSALMGNTGVALARDGSAPFLNPATIVRINDNSLAFSVNFYSFGATSFVGWHQPAPVDTSHFGNVALKETSISTNGFRVLPSTLCLFFTIRGVTAEGSDDAGLHRGRQKLAVCFGSTEFEDVLLPALAYQGSTPGGTTAQAQSIARSWNRFQAGPTYSISLSDDLAIGLSLHGAYTSESFVLDSGSITSALGGGAVQSSFDAAGSGHVPPSSGPPITGGTSPSERARSSLRCTSMASTPARSTASTASGARTPPCSAAARETSPRRLRCGYHSARERSGSDSSSSSTDRSSSRWGLSPRR